MKNQLIQQIISNYELSDILKTKEDRSRLEGILERTLNNFFNKYHKENLYSKGSIRLEGITDATPTDQTNVADFLLSIGWDGAKTYSNYFENLGSFAWAKEWVENYANQKRINLRDLPKEERLKLRQEQKKVWERLGKTQKEDFKEPIRDKRNRVYSFLQEVSDRKLRSMKIFERKFFAYLKHCKEEEGDDRRTSLYGMNLGDLKFQDIKTHLQQDGFIDYKYLGSKPLIHFIGTMANYGLVDFEINEKGKHCSLWEYIKLERELKDRKIKITF